MDLWLDLETASTLLLPLVGVFKYAPTTRILLNSWAIDNEPVRVDEYLTVDFMRAFNEADRIIAHNAEFDRTVLENRIGEAHIRFDRWYCTMAQARRHGLPGGLDKLCQVLGVPADKAKMKEGRALVLLFCKPNVDGVFNDAFSHPAEWDRFVQYGGLDVEAMREVHRRCPKWNDDHEHEIWLADQRVNARGFAVDTQFAKAAVEQLKAVSAQTDAAVEQATEGVVASARQRDALLAHILEAYGVGLPDLTAATLERRVNDPDLPDALRELLQLRQQSSRTSTSKYSTLLRCVCDDGRIRGALTYAGAVRTQRWAGNRFQPHNMMRPSIGKLKGQALKNEIVAGIRAIKTDVFDLLSEYPLPEVAASATRGCIVAPPSKVLTIGDYSNVEGRGLAWLAEEEWKLEAFRAYDAGEGPDLYKAAYSASFGVPVDEVGEGDERQIGKVQELMLGYGGGVGAFVTGAETYKVDLNRVVAAAWPLVPQDVRDETEGMWHWTVEKHRTLGLPEDVFRTCDAIKRLWRRRHPKIEQFWKDLEDACRHTIRTGEARTIGKLVTSKVGAWLRIWLPSGRYLSYPGVRLDGETITYMGQNQYTRTWSRISTYGGKLAENVTQAFCRDLLATAIVLWGEGPFGPAILHVHDELVVEGARGHKEELVYCMLEAGSKFAGLPLAVKASVTDRYSYKE